MFRRNLYFYFLLALFMSTLCGCVVSSNFYSAQTLEEKKFAIAFSADDILMKSSDKSVTISKKVPFAPSIGIAYGLPFRFETGLRYFPTKMLEISLRHQVNPRTFDILDCSINFNYGYLIDGYSYLKYGISVSKNIQEFEPYAHYTAYHFVNATQGDFSDSFISGAINNFIDNNRVIGFGIGLPLKSAKLFPEIDYQNFGNDFSNGMWHVGIGIRIYTN